MRVFDHELSRRPATVGSSMPGSVCNKIVSALFAAAICCGSGLATGYASTGLESTTANQTVALTDAIRSYQRPGISGSAGGAVSTVPAAGGLYFYHQIVLAESTQLPVTITNNQSTPLRISPIASAVDYPFTTDCTSGDTARSRLTPPAPSRPPSIPRPLARLMESSPLRTTPQGARSVFRSPAPVSLANLVSL